MKFVLSDDVIEQKIFSTKKFVVKIVKVEVEYEKQAGEKAKGNNAMVCELTKGGIVKCAR